MQKVSLERIGQKIREERLKRGLTQNDLGEQLYLHGSRISCMEKGEAAGNLEVLVLIANVLQIDVRVLVEAGIIE